ncbi:MAG: hypothetical protein IKF82_00870 [Bacilli bacterium]|nr:hypothetical protein [Bacilli bacterium]
MQLISQQGKQLTVNLNQIGVKYYDDKKSSATFIIFADKVILGRYYTRDMARYVLKELLSYIGMETYRLPATTDKTLLKEFNYNIKRC